MLSCNNDNSRINSFNQNLPHNDRIVLEELVDLFEKLLRDNYGESKNQTRTMLNDIVNGNTIDWEYDKQEVCSVLNSFQNSTLELKGEKLKYDTVYAGISLITKDPQDTVVITITQDKDTSEELVYLTGNDSFKAQVEQVKEYGYWNLLNRSSFVQALKHERNPELINQYIHRREAVGKWSHKFIAKSMGADSAINFNDYFIKRIVVFEVFYENLRIEHGC
ncbi:MAG: hypothetical protein ACI86M_000177 [Saprospiraceae bacterium]